MTNKFLTYSYFFLEVQKLFDEIQWDSTNYENKISVEDIQLFLDEYAKEI
ncbi:hypothetical protein [Methanobrevibacter sp.]